MTQNPRLVIILSILIIVEVIVVLTTCSPYFPVYTDIIVFVLLIACGYYAYKYFQAKSKLPNRICSQVPLNQYKKIVGNETDTKLKQLINDQRFRKLQEQKVGQKDNQQQRTQIQQDSEDGIIRQLVEKQDQIFD